LWRTKGKKAQTLERPVTRSRGKGRSCPSTQGGPKAQKCSVLHKEELSWEGEKSFSKKRGVVGAGANQEGSAVEVAINKGTQHCPWALGKDGRSGGRGKKTMLRSQGNRMLSHRALDVREIDGGKRCLGKPRNRSGESGRVEGRSADPDTDWH